MSDPSSYSSGARVHAQVPGENAPVVLPVALLTAGALFALASVRSFSAPTVAPDPSAATSSPPPIVQGLASTEPPARSALSAQPSAPSPAASAPLEPSAITAVATAAQPALPAASATPTPPPAETALPGVASAAPAATAAPAACAQLAVLFGYAEHLPSADAEEALGALAQWLVARPQAQVVLEGHADSMGNEIANFRLSRRRARAIAGSLERGGVATARITVRALGAYVPLEGHADTAGENRRVHLYLRGADECFRAAALEMPSQPGEVR